MRAMNYFRRRLLRNGFVKFQYSIYIRHCCTYAHANMYEAEVTSSIPKNGKVSVLRIRDKQFGRMRNFWGGMEKTEEYFPKKHANSYFFFRFYEKKEPFLLQKIYFFN
ncbi:MAG: CRISPR-associated endonuclease Cas2 [Bacteroidota bacterium]